MMVEVKNMKLFKVLTKYGPTYQTEPKCGTGIGRFQVCKTDNANARAIGRRPRWTVTDLYTLKRECLDTLAEVREWCEKEEKKSVAKLPM